MTKQIPLAKGKFALVDDEDYDYLMQWKWYCSNRGYAVRSEYSVDTRPYTVSMHRVILNVSTPYEIDHRNGNRTDNQRHNLRIVTRSQNIQNSRKATNKSSIYKGVTWSKRLGKWIAQIKNNVTGKLHLGVFDNEIDAALAYDEAARRCYGEYARTNF